ncbi:PRK06851 family protein [Thermincola ferriacetica]
MLRGGSIKRIFPGGNTAQGFYSFYDSVLQDMDRIFIIKGGPGTGKSSFMRRIGLALADRGYNVEFLCCSSDNDSLDGIVVSDLKLAMVDGTAPHIVDPKNPGAVDQIINLGEFWDEEMLRQNKEAIIKCGQEVWECFREAYKCLKEAKTIHDEWEDYYAEGMDYTKANQMADSIINEIFSRQPVTRHMFASAITPEGLVNYIDNITEGIGTRYIIKGQPGTGKSTLLKKVAQAAADRGYNVDIYHCSLDPESLDMVVIPEINIAVINGMPPHTVEPSRDGDRVIDMLECVLPQVVEQNRAAVDDTEKRFNRKIEEAIQFISKAKKLHDELETYYIDAMDFAAVDEMRDKIMTKVLALSSGKTDFKKTKFVLQTG